MTFCFILKTRVNETQPLVIISILVLLKQSIATHKIGVKEPYVAVQ